MCRLRTTALGALTGSTVVTSPPGGTALVQVTLQVSRNQVKEGSSSPPFFLHLFTLPQTEYPYPRPWPTISSDVHSLWNVIHSSSLRSQMTSFLQPPLSAQVQPHPLLIRTGSIQGLSCGDYDYQVELHMFCRIVLISLIIWTLSVPFHISCLGSGGRPDTSCMDAL